MDRFRGIITIQGDGAYRWVKAWQAAGQPNLELGGLELNQFVMQWAGKTSRSEGTLTLTVGLTDSEWPSSSIVALSQALEMLGRVEGVDTFWQDEVNVSVERIRPNPIEQVGMAFWDVVR